MAAYTTRESDSWVGSFAVPDKPDAWAQLARTGGVLRQTIHRILRMGSGSKVRKHQFTMFRAYWPRMCSPKDLEASLGDFGLDDYYGQAQDAMERSTEFRLFLRTVGTGMDLYSLREGDPGWAGSWMPALRWIRQCLDPIDITESADIKDEAIVNTTLLVLLDCIESLARPLRVRWTIQQMLFTPVFENAQFTTITDGALMARLSRRVLGLVEVKRKARYPEPDTIKVQETAEMVGLIKGGDGREAIFNGKRLLVAQDGGEAWVIFAEAGPGYERYLNERDVRRDPFLVLQEFGPYHLGNVAAVERFCRVILCILLAADSATNYQQL